MDVFFRERSLAFNLPAIYVQQNSILKQISGYILFPATYLRNLIF